MTDSAQGMLRDGEIAYVKGSAATPYALKNIGGVYSCSCPAWRNQSRPIERRTCKHLKKLLGEEVELDRIGEDSSAAKGKGQSGAEERSVPGLLLAERWDTAVDPSGWWLSEKLDGVRAYWDGETFLSRTGNPYLAPAWFTESLGREPLDGELWMGRGQFQQTVSVVRRQDRSEHWQRVRYVVFDLPGSGEPFEARMARLTARFDASGAEHVSVLAQARCESAERLDERLRELEADGGEGLMLREPGSVYEPGRSTTLLKVKSFLDADARVIEHLAGKGRHKGRVGALRVELPDTTQFSVGSGLSDAQRERPPEIGTIITFRYQELTDGGVPRFPTFVGERADGAWAGAPSIAHQQSATSEAAPAAEPGVRRLEYSDAKSHKFWQIQVEGSAHTVTYGRVGSKGRESTKTFASPELAQQDADKLIASKISKGYA